MQTNKNTRSYRRKARLDDILARSIRMKQVKNPATNVGGVSSLPPYRDTNLLIECFGNLLFLALLACLVWGLSVAILHPHIQN